MRQPEHTSTGVPLFHLHRDDHRLPQRRYPGPLQSPEPLPTLDHPRHPGQHAAPTRSTPSRNPGVHELQLSAFVPGTLTIGQATLTVTAANASRAYGTANPAFSASATGALPGDTFTFTESTTATTASPGRHLPHRPARHAAPASLNYTVVYVNGTPHNRQGRPHRHRQQPEHHLRRPRSPPTPRRSPASSTATPRPLQ